MKCDIWVQAKFFCLFVCLRTNVMGSASFVEKTIVFFLTFVKNLLTAYVGLFTFITVRQLTLYGFYSFKN